MKRLLSSRPPLEHLQYDYHCAENIRFDRSHYLDISVLCSALEQVSSTLESLTISVGFESDADGIDCYANGPFKGSCSLHAQGWPRLKYVNMPFVMLVGWKCDSAPISKGLEQLLPSSIEKLCLTDELAGWVTYEWEGSDWVESLRLMLDTRAIRDLREISLKIGTIRNAAGWEGDDTEKFMSLCRQHEVVGSVE